MKKFFVLSLFFLVGSSLFAQVFFTGEGKDNTDIFQVDLSTDRISSFTEFTSDEKMMAVSADRKVAAAVSNRAGADSLYIFNLSDPKNSWENLSPGMGAYANPAFSPDGKSIAVSYSPDPEMPFSNSQIVIVDIASRSQRVVVSSSSFVSPGASDQLYVVDRPKWLDRENLLFVLIEYGDAELMRIISSGLYRVPTSGEIPVHVCGGESYFDEAGKPMGYKASMPFIDDGKIFFVAIEGLFNRTPMWMSFDGKEKKVLPFRDPEFFGPVFPIPGGFFYGIQDEKGLFGLAHYSSAAKKRTAIPFAGNAMEPTR